MQRFYLGLDVGGTSARVLAVDQNGNRLDSFTGAGCTLNVNGYAQSRQRYRDLVLGAMEKLSLEPGACAGICVAASGIDAPKQHDECREIFLEMGFLPDTLRVVNDSEVFLLGEKGPLAVLVSGTGSIAMVKDAQGAIQRRGGWGQLLSDEGSAFWLGLEVLRAVGNHLDNRRACPILWQLFQAHSPLRDTIALNDFVMQHIGDKSPIASLARLADQAAGKGDETARELLESAAAALYRLLRDALRTLPAAELSSAGVLLWGSVLTGSATISSSLQKQLMQKFGLAAAYPENDALGEAVRVARQG